MRATEGGRDLVSPPRRLNYLSSHSRNLFSTFYHTRISVVLVYQQSCARSRLPSTRVSGHPAGVVDLTNEGVNYGRPDDPARALRLFGDRRSPAAQAAGRGRIVFWTIVNLRGLGHLAADGAPGDSGADRAGAAAGRAELELARIRHARRRVGVSSTLQAARHPARRSSINARVCEDYERVAGRRKRRRLGVHGPRLRADADPQGRETRAA